MPDRERIITAERARQHALQFDRTRVFDRLLGRLAGVTERELSLI
jgi:hypothetical protein